MSCEQPDQRGKSEPRWESHEKWKGLRIFFLYFSAGKKQFDVFQNNVCQKGGTYHIRSMKSSRVLEQGTTQWRRKQQCSESRINSEHISSSWDLSKLHMKSPGLSSSQSWRKSSVKAPMRRVIGSKQINIHQCLCFPCLLPVEEKNYNIPKIGTQNPCTAPKQTDTPTSVTKTVALRCVVRTPLGQECLFLFSTRLISVSLIAFRVFDAEIRAHLQSRKP